MNCLCIAERYEVAELAGKGGMGAVYKAFDRQLKRHVAAKLVLHAANASQSLAATADRARREAQFLAKANHPNILQVYDVISDETGVWIVSEWIEGIALDKHLLHGSTDFRKVAQVFCQILDGLAAIHAQRVIHRDLKPSNIMIAQAGQAKLIDFGIAFHPDFSSGETLAGSLKYVDPRILAGSPPDQVSDIYACGVIMLECLTGEDMWPDLAPLPLYREIEQKLESRVAQLTRGLHPEIAGIASDMVLMIRSGAAADETIAKNAARRLQSWLERLDSRYEGEFRKEYTAKIATKKLRPKEKSAWLNYAHRTGMKPDARRGVWHYTLAVVLLATSFAVWKYSLQHQEPAVAIARQTLMPEMSIASEPKPLEHTAKPRDDRTAEASTAPVAVYIRANAWADVYIDDLPVGRIPRALPFHVRPGVHRIRLSSPLVQTYEAKISVVAGSKSPPRYVFVLTPKKPDDSERIN